KTESPALHEAFCEATRYAEGESHFIRNSGNYPLCGRGDINLYPIFAERVRTLLSDTGRLGLVLPTAIATGDTTKAFFQDMVGKHSLASLYSFFEIRELFPATDSRESFCLLTAGSGRSPAAEHAVFVFLARTIDDLADSERRFTLSA